MDLKGRLWAITNKICVCTSSILCTAVHRVGDCMPRQLLRMISFLLSYLYISHIYTHIRFALRFIRPDPRGRVTDPVGDVVSFIHSFEEKYGRSHPVFYQGTYSQVS